MENEVVADGSPVYKTAAQKLSLEAHRGELEVGDLVLVPSFGGYVWAEYKGDNRAETEHSAWVLNRHPEAGWHCGFFYNKAAIAKIELSP